jgi:hypothetical protein
MATNYKINDRVIYNGTEPGTIVNIVTPKCKCKGKQVFHVMLDNDNRKITVREKYGDTLEPLNIPEPSKVITPFRLN